MSAFAQRLETPTQPRSRMMRATRLAEVETPSYESWAKTLGEPQILLLRSHTRDTSSANSASRTACELGFRFFRWSQPCLVTCSTRHMLTSRGRIIMDEEDVLAMCQAAPWTRVVASHMEAVNHGNVSRRYLRAFVDRLGVGSQVLIPEDGETLEF